ncbi:Oligopeptide transporter, OPT superfamily [Dillenia turbinata]|uniref:Oligopeptide transporter, OPT superfamily n=1 Tax=Dillenia turbinata TaxID=194707 RepID=A0AAN8UPB4_9MAGN
MIFCLLQDNHVHNFGECRALHEKESKANGMTRMKFFYIFMEACFLPHAAPGYLFQIITFFHCQYWITAFHETPLVAPFSSIINIGVGFIMFIYIIVPLCYWKYNTFEARKFPMFSNKLFSTMGQPYDISRILTADYDLNTAAYERFARFTATLTHVALFHWRDIWRQSRPAMKNAKIDIHGRLVKKIRTDTRLVVPGSAFRKHHCFFGCVIHLEKRCNYHGGECSLPLPWQLLSRSQSASFKQQPTRTLHEIPSTLHVRSSGTRVAGIINLVVAWGMLDNIEGICNIDSSHPDSPWTCPKYSVTFDASVIWGLIGPKRLFGPGEKKWIPLINIPVISYGFAAMRPATPTNIASWLITGTFFDYFVFRYRKGWRRKYNYALSAALDAGTAFMGVFLFFALQNTGHNLTW